MSNPKDESDTGWSVAQSKRSKRQGKRPVPALQSEDGLRAPNPNPELSVDQLQIFHLRFKAMWLVHPNHDHYVTLATDLCAAHRHSITTAVCLGLGSADCASRGVAACKPVFTQLELFHTIVDVLQRAQGSPPIRCYFQDPKFTPPEVAYLQRLGHTVLAHPQAFERIDKSTFLYAPHLTWAAYLRALCTPDGPPAVVIGNSLDDLEVHQAANDIAKLLEKYEKQLKRLRKTHKQIGPLPHHDYILDGMMYWRDDEWDKQGDDGGEGCSGNGLSDEREEECSRSVDHVVKRGMHAMEHG